MAKKKIMRKRNFSGVKIATLIFACASLMASLYFSISSFTGYVVSEEINLSFNSFALVLFLAGLGGAYFVVKR